MLESWHIPMDILRLLCTTMTIIIALICLILIISHRECRTVPMMLIGNTCLTELICACTALSFVVFTLTNDLKQIQYEDSLCMFRAYINYAITVIQNHSYNLQALYRYMTVVYPSRRFWQLRKFQVLLIVLTWIFGFIVFLPFLFTGYIIYNAENQICQAPIRPSFAIFYIAFVLYMIPNMILNIIYLKLVRFVRQMNRRVVSVGVVSRAERELKMVKNIVTITTILIVLGLPYAIFILMSIFTTIPKYHFRIAFIFVDISTTAVMIGLFTTTDPIVTAAKGILNSLWSSRQIGSDVIG